MTAKKIDFDFSKTLPRISVNFSLLFELSITFSETGTYSFSMWVKKSGNYRISKVPHKSKMELIFAPEKSGIVEAFVMRNDSLIYPAEIVLGGKALIISHERESSDYSILARFISDRGEESEVLTIPLTSCFDKTSSTKNLGNNKIFKSNYS